MSMTIALPRLDRSACAWKATKLAVGGVVFIAMSLPIAFPAKDASSATAPVAPALAQPAAPARAQAPVIKVKAAAPTKLEAAQAPNRKPLPKNA